jgi:hypothetical protein
VNRLPEVGPAFVIGLPLIVETRLLVSQAALKVARGAKRVEVVVRVVVSVDKAVAVVVISVVTDSVRVVETSIGTEVNVVVRTVVEV